MTSWQRLERLRRLRTQGRIIAYEALAQCAAALAALDARHQELLSAEDGARSALARTDDPTTVALAWAYADTLAGRRRRVGVDRARAAHAADAAGHRARASRRDEEQLAFLCGRVRARGEAAEMRTTAAAHDERAAWSHGRRR